MKAVVYTKYGPPNVLQLKEIDKPVPKDNEILVRVYASSVSVQALLARSGKHPDSKFFTFILRLILGLIKPRKTILGFEFAGEIESVGKDVRKYKKGDKVFGTTNDLKNGAYAEYVCLPEERKRGVIALKPDNLSFEEAAAIPIGGMTAMYIFRKAKIKKGKDVLIYGASGSVGTYAIQLAKAYGAEVTGVCSKSNLEMVKSLGADFVIDYTKENFTQNGKSYDVIFDAVGKISKSFCKKSLKKDGVYLSVKTPTKELTEDLLSLKDMAETEEIKPEIDSVYPLEKITEAHAYADKGHKKGNVIITV